MTLIRRINDELFELYKDSQDVEYYINKWQTVYNKYGDADFYVAYKDNERNEIDVIKTLHSIDGETLLKMAIDLGIETPDFIPCIPTFKNELKSSFNQTAQTFEKAFKNVEEDPNLAIGLANSSLESIIKSILKDDRVECELNEKNSLKKLTKSICNAFKLYTDDSCLVEIRNIASSLLGACEAIENLRSDKTEMHGKTDSDYIVDNPLYAYFIVNAVTTIGLFFLKFYKSKYHIENKTTTVEDELPF